MSTISPLNAEQPPLTNETLAARGERRVAINSGLLLVAFSFQAFVSLLIVGITARYLGQSGLGRYAYAISLIELFVVLVDMGMNRILVREISKQREDTDRLTSSIWTLRLLLTVVVMVIVGIVAGGRDMEVWWAVMVYFVAQVVFLLGDVFGSVFQGYQRMEYQFWGINLAQVLLIAFTLAAVWLNFGLIGLFAARLLANAVRLAYVWWISVHKGFAKAHFQTSVLAGAWLAIRTAPVTLTSWRQDGKQQAKVTLYSLGERLGPRWQDATLAWHMAVESLPVGISLLLRSYIWRRRRAVDGGLARTATGRHGERRAVRTAARGAATPNHPGCLRRGDAAGLQQPGRRTPGRVRQRLCQEYQALRRDQPADRTKLHLSGRPDGPSVARRYHRSENGGAGVSRAGLGDRTLLPELALRRDAGGAGQTEAGDRRIDFRRNRRLHHGALEHPALPGNGGDLRDPGGRRDFLHRRHNRHVETFPMAHFGA